jgi:phage tail-like protein
MGADDARIASRPRRGEPNAAALPTLRDMLSAAMAERDVNPPALHAYKKFRFRIKWEGRYVAGFDKVSPQKRFREAMAHRESQKPRKSAGRSGYEAVTLERGVTHDAEFERWASKVWNAGSDVPRSSPRRDIIIETFNESGQPALAYKLFRCWVSEYQALADLDANANAVAIQHIKLENEGFERDTVVPEPTEPSSVDA